MQGKRLYRSSQDRIFLGVAGGLAEYFEVDPTLVRLVFLILSVWGGAGIVIYIILAIATPEREEGENMATKKVKEVKTPEKKARVVAEEVDERPTFKRWQGEQLFGAIVLGVGLIFLLENFIPGFSFGRLWPLILIGLGLWMIAGREER